MKHEVMLELVKTTSGTAWANSLTQRLVATQFNRRNLELSFKNYSKLDNKQVQH